MRFTLIISATALPARDPSARLASENFLMTSFVASACRIAAAAPSPKLLRARPMVAILRFTSSTLAITMPLASRSPVAFKLKERDRRGPRLSCDALGPGHRSIPHRRSGAPRDLAPRATAWQRGGGLT